MSATQSPASPPSPPSPPSPLSLRQTEAQQRFDLLAVTSYDVSLDLASSEETFTSVTRIEFESAGGTTFVDLKPTHLAAVRLNDESLDVGLLARGRFPLDTVAGANVLVVEATMPFRNDGEGLHRHVDPVDGKAYVYAMSFMDAAPTIFACFDQPDLKAPYTWHVRAPEDWVVVGNAPATGGDGEWELGPTQPLSTYFVTLVAGPYHLLRSEHDGIPLGLSCRASLAEALDADADELFEMTGQCFDEFHRLFGIRYPFGDYHQAFVPEFNAGAMENPGCVTFRDQLVFDTRVTRGMRIQRATTVAHEMAHQWFGNIVTPKWWDDLWLNESFAEYMGNRVTAEVTRYDDAWTHVSWSRRQWGLGADQKPSTHPVAGNGAEDALLALQNFDGISYAKGSSILKQLATSLGDEVFFSGAVDHFTSNRFGNATMHDLFASWERAGAGDLSGVTEQWLRTAGADVIRLDRDRGVLERRSPAAHPADRTHRLAVLRLPDGRESGLDVSSDETPLPDDALAGIDGATALVIDPREESWGVYVPDATTVRALVDVLPGVTDTRVQAAIWNNVKSGFSVAGIDPDAVIDLLEARLPVEDTEDTLRQTKPWVMGEVVPAASTGALARLHAAALGRLAETRAGDELQLSSFRWVVSTTDDLARLHEWLAGSGLPDGIDLDVDLRWRLLTQLAVLGDTDHATLDAALADETTVFTQVMHSRAVASLPTPEAKAWAWARFTGEVSVANYELEAAGRGLWRAGHEDVTRPYVERYVADLAGIAEVHSGWMQAVVAEAYFPASHADEDSLALLRPLVDDDALPGAVRRRVVDQLDTAERKLAVRAAFPRS
ncbi:MAG: aminopeptidase N [Nocardioides sp.]|uniref:aminopeptidase N n=1 Tax=Nocardioides sp. TaxID=35761 RepID=UPI00239849A9|nr:aminopeptidase N [Nocardioides sp.]MDE0778271.1 aminopeptidase N [Nocardioides sp.]